ncbi:hypothetical protein N7457_006240 [Penicillium paradoxum]|uniref:uncharacterized protein n=1 Tax=Penicillium paradoxum TaxID=176176 RepID=UPI0025489605|nr:uncharacterized protein N7457_006240 [Penicillium paradoxum]KAJ5781080.1 hypothetical protein N7457_006240 [Penicillium paradoxum]
MNPTEQLSTTTTPTADPNQHIVVQTMQEIALIRRDIDRRFTMANTTPVPLEEFEALSNHIYIRMVQVGYRICQHQNLVQRYTLATAFARYLGKIPAASGVL